MSVRSLTVFSFVLGSFAAWPERASIWPASWPFTFAGKESLYGCALGPVSTYPWVFFCQLIRTVYRDPDSVGPVGLRQEV